MNRDLAQTGLDILSYADDDEAWALFIRAVELAKTNLRKRGVAP